LNTTTLEPSTPHLWQQATLRQDLIDHIMKIRLKDEAYARSALRSYNALMPWLMLNEGIREAMKGAE
jgi:hypothetical protein